MTAQLAAFGGAPALASCDIVPWPAPNDRHLAALREVLASGKYHRVNHPLVARLERKIARWSGFEHARCTGSGTAAIHIALDLLGRPGSRVLVSALNWPGAVGPLVAGGLEPEFVDVDPRDACISMDEAVLKCNGDTSAIMITHLFGNAVDATGPRRQMAASGIAIVDDCAQAIGAGAFLGRQKLPTDAVVFSGNGAKHLGAGEIGVLASPHMRVMDHVDVVSLSSSSRNGERIFSPQTYGFNYRPNVFSAAIASDRMDDMPEQVAARRANVARLAQRLSALPGIVPLWRDDQEHNSFCSAAFRIDFDAIGLECDSIVRDRIVALLEAEGAPVGVWLNQPVWTYLPRITRKWHGEDFPHARHLLQSMFYVREVAPPNGLAQMDMIAAAFAKVWDALQHLRDHLTQTQGSA